MPTVIDYVFIFVLLVVMSLVEHFWFWPRFRADAASDRPDARVGGYRLVVGGQTAFGVITTAIWLSHGRPLADLGLGMPGGWRLALSVGLVGAMGWFARLQLGAIGRTTAERRVALRPKMGAVAFMLPHTSREHRWFVGLSLTAGICEELIYRGYLMWVFARWIGTAGAALAVVALFGIGHAYQGRKGFTRATLAGAVMGAIVLATGWIVPAMIVHALVDALSGTVGYIVLRTNSADNSAPSVPASGPTMAGAAPA